MSNTAHITSDLKHAVVSDCTNGGKISIGRRGVLLSVLGNEMVGSEVTAKLDRALAAKLKGEKPFFQFDMQDLEKNHLCVSYQEQSNILYVIGIDDVIITFAAPTEVPSNKLKTVAVKLKANTEEGLIARHIVLVRLEGKIGRSRKLTFYLIDAEE